MNHSTEENGMMSRRERKRLSHADGNQQQPNWTESPLNRREFMLANYIWLVRSWIIEGNLSGFFSKSV